MTLIKNYFLPMLSTLLLAIISLTSNAYDIKVNGLCYNKNADGTTVYVTYERMINPSYSNLSGDIVIPTQITYYGNTYSVISIGKEAFRGCSNLTSVSIPNTITSIGNSAFSGCSGLTGDLIIPNSVTSIGNSAFSGCSGLTGDLIIPNSVTSIGNSAFYSCSGFNGSLKISESISAIEASTFSGCSGLTGDLIIPNSVTSIGNDAFSGCKGFDGSLALPDGVTAIGNKSFSSCKNLSGSLIIPHSVRTIGKWAFAACSGFTDSLVIGDSVTEIGDLAFQDCDGFTGSLTLGKSLKKIGENAFHHCRGFTGPLVIPDSVSIIDVNTFSGCKGLTSLVIGNSVTRIEASAFSGCSGLKTLTLPNSVTFIGNNSFSQCSGLSSLILPNSITIIDKFAFYACDSIKSMVIGRGVDSIGNYAFSMKGLADIRTEISMPQDVRLGESVFSRVNKKTCQLNVPLGSLEDYKNADQWKDFINIKDYIIPIVSLEITPDSINLFKDDQTTLLPTIVPDNASLKLLTWASSNTDVAVVDDMGVVTGVGPGQAFITATTTDGSNLSDTCYVTINAPFSLSAQNVIMPTNSVRNVSIEIDNQTPVESFAFTVSVPEGLQFFADALPDTRSNNFSITTSYNEDSTLVHVQGMMTVSPIPVGTGSFLQIPIKSGDAIDNFELRLTNIEFTSAAAAVGMRQMDDIIIALRVLAWGDINADGKVDVSDLNSLVNVILGKDTDIIDLCMCDLDNNNSVDVGDVNKLVNIILGKE